MKRLLLIVLLVSALAAIGYFGALTFLPKHVELPIIKEIFDLRYSYIFQNYYLKNLREFNLNGLDIKLSEETKTYNDLLQKDHNYNIKNVFEKVINRFY